MIGLFQIESQFSFFHPIFQVKVNELKLCAFGGQLFCKDDWQKKGKKYEHSTAETSSLEMGNGQNTSSYAYFYIFVIILFSKRF